MSEGIPRYLVEGPDQDELLTDNELGIAEAMNKRIGVGVGVSTMEAACSKSRRPTTAQAT